MDRKEYTKNTSALFLFMPIFFLLVIGIFVSLVQVQQQQQTHSRASTASSHDCTVSNTQLDITSQEEALLNEINQFRQQNGAGTLTITNPLNQAASWMSNDMMVHNSLNHTDSFGRDTAGRLSDCGLQNAAVIGEIIDSGTSDPTTVISTWEHIPSQSANLLNKNFTQVGVSLSGGDATHQAFWTVDFSGPGNPTPTLTPRPTQSPTYIPTPTYNVTPTITPIVATPTPYNVFPKLLNLSPNPANRNANVTVTGSLASNASATFQLFLDNVPKGTMSCQSGTCQGFIFVSSSAAPGLHIVSVDGGSTLILNVSADAGTDSGSGSDTGSGTGTDVVTPLPTGKFTPTDTPIPVTPLPTIDPSFVANPNDMQIFISIKVPGIGKDGNEIPKHLTRKVVVTIFGLDNQPVVTGTADLKYDGDLFRGIVHFGKVADGTYYLKVIGPGMLQTYVLPEFQQLSTSKLNLAPDTLMEQGDLNADNAVTIDDYNIALACFQNNQCGVTDGLTQNALDFNDDGVTNVADYNLLLQTFWHFSGD